MEDSELDDWFNEQRELLEEKVYAGLSGKDPLKAKVEFDKKYRALIAEFQKKQGKLFDDRVRSAKLQAPIAHFKERYSLFFKGISVWFKARKLAVKKWFFERKVKRILRDKSDLY